MDAISIQYRYCIDTVSILDRYNIDTASILYRYLEIHKYLLYLCFREDSYKVAHVTRSRQDPETFRKKRATGH